MERKILLAVDNSRNSKHAVKYVCRMFASDQEAHFDLLNIQPAISDFLIQEAKRTASARRRLDKLFKENTAHSRQILSDLATLFTDSGISENRFTTHTQPRNRGTAKDILDFAMHRRFDAIVIGRRGMSGLQDMIFGSVSNNIVQQSQILPVWMVDGDPAPGKLMVAVDGSSHSLKAVDHLAFIVAGRKDLQLVFFHVQPKLRQFCQIDFDNAVAAPLEDLVATGDTRCIENFYGQARQRLAEAGIEEDQIEIKANVGLRRVGSQIVKELSTGGYDTLILGRSGSNHSHFMGSVAMHVIGKAADCALWVVN